MVTSFSGLSTMVEVVESFGDKLGTV